MLINARTSTNTQSPQSTTRDTAPRRVGRFGENENNATVTSPFLRLLILKTPSQTGSLVTPTE